MDNRRKIENFVEKKKAKYNRRKREKKSSDFVDDFFFSSLRYDTIWKANVVQ